MQVADGKEAAFAEAVKERQPYYKKRIDLFEQYHAREEAAIEAAKAANVPIKVTLPDGAAKEGIKGATTPLDIANQISKSLAKKVVVAKVDGDEWDLFRPLEGDCNISLHTFDEPEGKEVRSNGGRGACRVQMVVEVPQPAAVLATLRQPEVGGPCALHARATLVVCAQHMKVLSYQSVLGVGNIQQCKQQAMGSMQQPHVCVQQAAARHALLPQWLRLKLAHVAA